MQNQGCVIKLCLLLLTLLTLVKAIKVDRATSTFRDEQNRTRVFHGLNYVKKAPPHYPLINTTEIRKLQAARKIELSSSHSQLIPSPV